MEENECYCSDDKVNISVEKSKIKDTPRIWKEPSNLLQAIYKYGGYIISTFEERL